MNTFSRILFGMVLVITLMGCQEDESGEKPDQQQNPLGQMQQPASDVELKEGEAAKFVDAAMNAQEIQMQNQQKMIGIIEDEGLDVESFQRIARAIQQGQAADSVSDSDMEKFESANESMEAAQGNVQEKITKSIEETGMDIERFQQISQAAQQDPELRKKIQQKFQEKVGGAAGPQDN